MTAAQKIAHRFFVQMTLLLLAYAALVLLAALDFLTPDAAPAIPYPRAGALANTLLNLAALTGLLGGGVYLAASQRPDSRLPRENLLRGAAWLWAALLALAAAAGLLGWLEGRHLLELPPLLVVIQAAAVVGVMVAVAAVPRSPLAQLWLVGLGIAVVGMLINLLPPADYVQDRALRALSAGLRINIACPLAAVALGFWLMHRFSNITPGWADTSVYSAAGVVTLAGALVTLPPLHMLAAPGRADWMAALGSASVIVVPALYLMLAAHGYRALSDRNLARTLSAHWYALALLLFLLGPGLLGSLQADPDALRWTLGTRLTDLQHTLTALIPVAMALGTANQAAAELRGRNWRVTGLIPFWLVAFGIIIGALGLAGAGLAQTYLERRLGLDYLHTQALIAPLYRLWAAGWLAVTLGAGVYALTFWLRRPRQSGAG